MAYEPDSSNSETTLLETFATRKGVCRDYAHLLCGRARASQIPARYVSAYGLSVNPPDFRAVAQVWLDNQWHLVDPTGMCAADEFVLIGVGRNAADVPFMETPDEARFVDQKVRMTAECYLPWLELAKFALVSLAASLDRVYCTYWTLTNLHASP